MNPSVTDPVPGAAVADVGRGAIATANLAAPDEWLPARRRQQARVEPPLIVVENGHPKPRRQVAR